MSNTIGWGEGSVNNSIGWGDSASNSNGYGSVYTTSWSGETNLVNVVSILTVDSTSYKADSTLLTADIYYF
jgi:hypothetical protein